VIIIIDFDKLVEDKIANFIKGEEFKDRLTALLPNILESLPEHQKLVKC
jgi:hypothetical protein